ncbi:proton-coupled amino acid transporter-like protein CG1139 [Diaphorina citri]|uniref:Proton-coupled amino acid transporter-like protein CG1139 n=1 Tax=Diaphorina citri TaxID=121845 RepID=A0A3Q0IZT3_DIACI|nr:proton-coupled amino acid transporter-like protein CG1139 [Diaphorina citri]
MVHHMEVKTALNGSDSNLEYTTASTAKLSDLNTTARSFNGLAKDPDLESAYDPFAHRDQKKTTSDTGALLHMLKSSLGSGILAMPMAFKNSGLMLGAFGTIIVGILCTYCVHMLLISNTFIYSHSKLFFFREFVNMALLSTYYLGNTVYVVFIASSFREFVNMALLSTYYLGNTVYVVFIASSFKQVIDNHMNIDLNIRIYIIIVCIPLIPLGIIRNLKNLVVFSAVATVFIMVGIVIDNHMNIDLNIRIYIIIVCIPLIPLGIIRNLKNLVVFSAVATVFIMVGIAFTLYFTVTDLPDTSTRHNVAPFTQFPLFFSTVLFAMEGIGTVLPIENSMKKPGHFLGKFGVLNISAISLTASRYIPGSRAFLSFQLSSGNRFQVYLHQGPRYGRRRGRIPKIPVKYPYCTPVITPLDK